VQATSQQNVGRELGICGTDLLLPLPPLACCSKLLPEKRPRSWRGFQLSNGTLRGMTPAGGLLEGLVPHFQVANGVPSDTFLLQPQVLGLVCTWESPRPPTKGNESGHPHWG